MAIPDAQKAATVAEQKALGVKLDAVVAGVGGQTEGYTHADADSGVMVLGVRQDVAAALALDGKYIPFSVDGSGNLRVAATLTSNTEYDEDTAHTTADKGNLVFAVRKDAAAALADTDGDYIPFMCDGTGQLYIALPGTAEADLAAIKAAMEAALTVSATDLDIRNLVNTDVVTVEQATHDSLNLNANLQVANADADVGAGAAGAATQRVSISSDDVLLAAIKAAVESYVGGSIPLDSEAVGVGTTTATPAVAIVNENTSGDRTIVTAAAGEVIKVVGYHLVASGDVTVTWKSVTAGAIGGPLDLTTNSGAAPYGGSLPVLKSTTAGENLVLNLDASIAVGGTVTYLKYTP